MIVMIAYESSATFKVSCKFYFCLGEHLLHRGMDRVSVNARLNTLKSAEAAALRRGDHDAAKRVRAFFYPCVIIDRLSKKTS